MQPDAVLVELCKSRVDILKYDEEFLLREAKNIDLEKLKLAIKQVCKTVLLSDHGGLVHMVAWCEMPVPLENIPRVWCVGYEG